MTSLSNRGKSKGYASVKWEDSNFTGFVVSIGLRRLRAREQTRQFQREPVGEYIGTVQ